MESIFQLEYDLEKVIPEEHEKAIMYDRIIHGFLGYLLRGSHRGADMKEKQYMNVIQRDNDTTINFGESIKHFFGLERVKVHSFTIKNLDNFHVSLLENDQPLIRELSIQHTI